MEFNKQKSSIAYQKGRKINSTVQLKIGIDQHTSIPSNIILVSIENKQHPANGSNEGWVRPPFVQEVLTSLCGKFGGLFYFQGGCECRVCIFQAEFRCPKKNCHVLNILNWQKIGPHDAHDQVQNCLDLVEVCNELSRIGEILLPQHAQC